MEEYQRELRRQRVTCWSLRAVFDGVATLGLMLAMLLLAML